MRMIDVQLDVVNTPIGTHHCGMAETLGTLIRRERERKGLRSIDLAARLGIQQSTLSRYENDKQVETPPPGILAAIERELGIPQERMLRALGYLPESRTGEVGIAESPPAYGPDDPHARIERVVAGIRDPDDLDGLAGLAEWWERELAKRSEVIAAPEAGGSPAFYSHSPIGTESA